MSRDQQLRRIGVSRAGQPVPPSTTSHTCPLTNLANHVQPIIRYDLGDRIRIVPQACPESASVPMRYCVRARAGGGRVCAHRGVRRGGEDVPRRGDTVQSLAGDRPLILAGLVQGAVLLTAILAVYVVALAQALPADTPARWPSSA